MAKPRCVVGFFTDDEGVVHPITNKCANGIRAEHGRHRKLRHHYVPEALSDEDARLWEELAQEAEYEEAMREATSGQTARYAGAGAGGRGGHTGWVSMRSEIMRRGGIARGPYTRHEIPDGLYRLRGEKPDELAAELGWESADDMLHDLNREFLTYKAIRRTHRRPAAALARKHKRTIRPRAAKRPIAAHPAEEERHAGLVW